MRFLNSTGLALLSVTAVFAAIPASANVTAVLTATNGNIKVSGQPKTSFSGAQINAAVGGTGLTGGGIQATSQLTGGLIEFQNGVISGGPGSVGDAFTEVAVTFQNTSSKSVIPILDSTLLPAGLGFLLGDIVSDVAPGTCAPTQLNNCSQTTKGASISQVKNATAGFKFDILDGGTSIYTLSGDMAIDANGNVVENLGAARSTLLNFGLDTVPGDSSAIGYSWDMTHVTLTLAALGAGQSRTLTYRVYTWASATGNCAPVPGTNAFNKTCAIGYSVFGDPVRSGGIINSIMVGGDSPFLTAPLSGIPVAGIAFNTLTPLLAPTFDSDTGQLGVFLPAPVPEPASWALMIGGFGMVGATLRRRRAAFA
ncbi:PEPxxWA-CTERM sorting domain-containing protein [Polymorphobacter arshaanensis]|uniref:PEPxxWA-CTERM sorting domain-containing protein n=1 Tax=Glacieibacterium arshaanense TaxID=2511025 RepID=UPI001FB0640D|nr:PEPxxWA-CTERM sorting domain-containing protein [Polymorphobacter arshaanensis]